MKKFLTAQKKFELRLADWNCTVGDTLILREWDPKTQNYTGRTIEKEITYVVKTKDIDFFTEEEVAKHGYQIISFD